MNNKDSLELTIQKLNILSSSNVLSSDYKQVINRAVDLLIEQREIVHCNDCKHYWEGYCEYGSEFRPQLEDYFCADGEQRTD